jgi:DNA-directed RNA polymerase subunit RPC12/RpoP
MICIRCGTRGNVRSPARTEAKRCLHCGSEIAFAPSAGDPLSDKGFARTIERVSAEAKLRFTVDQLYYELCRTLGPVAREVFDGLWTRWQAVHGTPAGIVTPWPAQGTTPTLREADIGDYSFDRVVITDSAWMVDFLLCNNFHFETNSAVLSIDGHPADRSEMIRGMLHENPRIIVIAIHDASVKGCGLAQRLITEDGWFRDHGYVIDVGLNPVHRELYGDLCQPREHLGDGLDAADPDAELLVREPLDLAMVRPEKVMRRLFKASRRYATMLTEPDGPRVGEVYLDDELLGPGKHKRGASMQELR